MTFGHRAGFVEWPGFGVVAAPSLAGRVAQIIYKESGNTDAGEGFKPLLSQQIMQLACSPPSDESQCGEGQGRSDSGWLRHWLLVE